MEKQVIFKSALNGFEKNAVLKYIDELNHKLLTAENNHQQMLEDWENEREELCDQNVALDLAGKELQKKLDAEGVKLQESAEALVAVQSELKKAQQENEEKEHELILLREQNRLLREQLSAQEEKCKKYDEAAASIGDAILEARQEGSRIVEEARSKAETILSSANEQAASIVHDAENDLSGIQKKMDSLKSQFLTIREQMNSSVALLNDQFGQVEASMSPAEEEPLPAETSAATETVVETAAVETESCKAEHPLKAILEQAQASAQKKNFFR